MGNKYIEEIAKLLPKIDLLAYGIGTKTDHDVFTRYNSRANYLEIHIGRYGWDFDFTKDREEIVINLDKNTAVEELQKTIKILEELEMEEE